MINLIDRRTFLGMLTMSATLPLIGCGKTAIRVLYFKGIPEEKLINDEIEQFQRDIGVSVSFETLEYDNLFFASNSDDCSGQDLAARRAGRN